MKALWVQNYICIIYYVIYGYYICIVCLAYGQGREWMVLTEVWLIDAGKCVSKDDLDQSNGRIFQPFNLTPK
jgi:hypothetical protein